MLHYATIISISAHYMFIIYCKSNIYKNGLSL